MSKYEEAASKWETRQGSMSKVLAERERLLSNNGDAAHSTHHHHGGSMPNDMPPIPNFAEEREKAMASNKKAMKKLMLVLCTSLIFICVEIVGGVLSGSIAIMSDAAHIASDVIGFGISICSLKIA